MNDREREKGAAVGEGGPREGSKNGTNFEESTGWDWPWMRREIESLHGWREMECDIVNDKRFTANGGKVIGEE